jgi:hypothetical protein
MQELKSGISSKVVWKGREAEKILLKQSSKKVVDQVFSSAKRMQAFDQSTAPQKGVFANMSEDQALKFYDRICKGIEKLILKRIGTARSDRGKIPFKRLLAWEKFQYLKKGPVKVTFGDAMEMKNKISERSSKTLIDRLNVDIAMKCVRYALAELEAYGIGGCGTRKFDHVEAWKQSDSQKKRGLPFNMAGSEPIPGMDKTVDEYIIEWLGNDTSKIARTAIKWLQEHDVMICLTGYRLQSPNKFRYINIPPVIIQYLWLPIINFLTDLYKKKVPFSAAWHDPFTGMQMINRQARRFWTKYLHVPYDFSGFDQLTDINITIELMRGILNLVFGVNKQTDLLLQTFELVEMKKGILVPASDPRCPFEIIGCKNLLISGIVWTSFLGTNYNLVLVAIVHIDLKSPKPLGSEQRLGDDLVAAILFSIYVRYGYSWILEQSEKSFNILGAEVNVKKQMPEDLVPGFIYLQRYYNMTDGWCGIYSMFRAWGSAIWSERFQSTVKGIRNLPALQMCGQLSVLNNVLIHTDDGLNNEIDEIMKWSLEQWLIEDDYLFSVFKAACKASSNDEDAGRMAFSYLNYAAGGADSVMRSLDLGDWSQNAYSTLTKDSAEMFFKSMPILPCLANIARKMGKAITSEYPAFFKMKTIVDKRWDGYDLFVKGEM